MRLFVSYAREDVARAKSIATALERVGHDVFMDLELESGVTYRPHLEDELRRADAVVVIWTTTSIGRQWVVEEASLALQLGTIRPIAVSVAPPLGFREVHTPSIPLLASGADAVRALGLGDPAPEPSRPTTTADRHPDQWYPTRSLRSFLQRVVGRSPTG